MSLGSGNFVSRLGWLHPRKQGTRVTPRVVAVLGAGLLTLSFLSVPHEMANITGVLTQFYLITVLSLVGAVALARLVRRGVALGVAGGSLLLGLVWYLVALPHDPLLAEIIQSNLRLLTGQSLLGIEQADVWALAVTPAPTVITWYLVTRRRYTTATLVGGVTLMYFVLTGDAGVTTTLTGVVGATALVGFGDLDRREVSAGAIERVALVLALMVLAPLVVTVVPGGSADPVSMFGSETPTMEENVVEAESELDIVGEIELTPEVRFTVESSEPRYWRTGSYDRYTGDGWVRSGEPIPYEETSLSGPPGDSTMLRQSITVETRTGTLPAAWQPTGISGISHSNVDVTGTGSLQYDGTLRPGESYEVTSAIQDPQAGELADSGTDYPEDVERAYTQLPDSTPDRVGERTDHITQHAENPLDKAILIERWLETNRDYSLDVDRPDGDVADAFLFEMDAGYCTYYATTMVTMLRTQDIPARLAVGYTSGEQIGEDQWVVRGMNSHAWVEVYFPETGWVQFDPTPPGPRDAAELDRLSEARESGEQVVDTNETDPELPDDEQGGETTDDTDEQRADTPEGVDERPGEGNIAEGPDGDDLAVPGGLQGVNQSTGLTEDGNDDSAGSGTAAEGNGDTGFVNASDLPDRGQLVLGIVTLVGIVAGVRQSGVPDRLSRRFKLRLQRRQDPETDIERAHDRLLLLLETKHRPRDTGETMRTYLDAIDAGPRVRRVARLREEARYGDSVSRDRADEAIELVDSLVASDSDTEPARSNW